jgi:hypothetical protein
MVRVLLYENTEKTVRKFQDFDHNVLVKMLETDNGFIEVIPMRTSQTVVRLYFDIDQYDTERNPLEDVLFLLCQTLRVPKEEWAIAECNRTDKLSYHIVSKTLCATIKTLRILTNTLKSKNPVFDTRVLYFGIGDNHECAYFRLPNQSKSSIGKICRPIKIVSGSISDFIITHTDNLCIINEYSI